MIALPDDEWGWTQICLDGPVTKRPRLFRYSHEVYPTLRPKRVQLWLERRGEGCWVGCANVDVSDAITAINHGAPEPYPRRK